MRRSYVINKESNEITFDLSFFKALIDKPKQADKDLSLLTLRLAFLLLGELDEMVPKKIPTRKFLADELGASRTSITNSLTQLEECGFIIRVLDNFIYMVCANEDDQKDLDNALKNELESARKNNGFNDKFKINSNYNFAIYSDPTDLENPEFLKTLIVKPDKLQKDIDRINDLERRVSLIERIFKIHT